MPRMAKAKTASTAQPPRSKDVSFERAAVLALGELRGALGALIAALPRSVGKVADLEDALDIDRRLAWQVFRIVNSQGPLAAGTSVPATASLDRFLKAAGRKGIPDEVCAGVAAAYSKFERFVGEHAADRSEYDLMIASTDPEAGDKLQLASRQAMFEAARSIRGIVVDTALSMHLSFLDSAKGDHGLSFANVLVSMGLRRLRRDAPQHKHTLWVQNPAMPCETFDGRPMTDGSQALLRQFCTGPVLDSLQAQTGVQLEYVLRAEDVGSRAASDCAIGHVLPASLYRYATPERATSGIGHGTGLPARRQILDLIHFDGLFEPQTPICETYETVPNGGVRKIPAVGRENDRVYNTPEPRYMGRGIESFRCVHVPRYQEILACLCASRGWDPAKLHGYRFEMEYPVYSWQTVFALRLPQKPGS